MSDPADPPVLIGKFTYMYTTLKSTMLNSRLLHYMYMYMYVSQVMMKYVKQYSRRKK